MNPWQTRGGGCWFRTSWVMGASVYKTAVYMMLSWQSIVLFSLIDSTSPKYNLQIGFFCGRSPPPRPPTVLASGPLWILLGDFCPKAPWRTPLPKSLIRPWLKCPLEKLVLDRGSRSDRPRYCVTTHVYAQNIDLWPWRMTLTFNHRRAMVLHIHKLKGQSVQKIESGNKRTDRRTPPIDLSSRLTRSVKITRALCSHWRDSEEILLLPLFVGGFVCRIT